MHPLLPFLLLFSLASGPSQPSGVQGYYRFPAIHGDTIVFTAHGDLFRVGLQGGLAQPLTTHPAEETRPAISPDGATVAFSASYEGPTEVYTMPIDGGLPARLTFEGERALVVGWTPDGRVLYTTRHYSTLPDAQLAAVDPRTHARSLVPLSQASDGCYDPGGGTIFFTRLPFQGSHTKRYQGGTAQNIWKFAAGTAEAALLTRDYAGTSKTPMWWQGRLYFASDRGGTMNLWSMDGSGGDLKQLTRHYGWDVQSPALDGGRIVYQLGADLHLYDIASGMDRTLAITLASDMDQLREKWIQKPMDYLTSARLSPSGDRVALTARGQVFVAPATQGRLVEASRRPAVRYRFAQFAPDGKSLIALSDQTGETEWWRLAANGVNAPKQLTEGAKVLRTAGSLSPDGKRLAFTDKNLELWIYDLEREKATKIASSEDDQNFSGLAWSPDSMWLAYVAPTATFDRIVLYSVKDERTTPVTTGRADSLSPAWSADGKWLYFLSNRTFQSLVRSPWGSRQPEPFFDRQTKIYVLALRQGLRSPFQPEDELHPAEPEKKPEGRPEEKGESGRRPPEVRIDLEGIQQRLMEVPVPAGNYEALSASEKRLFWITRETTFERKGSLSVLEIANRDVAAKTFVEDVRSYELSLDGKRLLARKGDDLYVLETAATAPASLDKKKVDLSGWSFPLNPREEWRQMFVEAWRLERDYFYDRSLHGVDWPAMLKKYLPLVDRVTDRWELSDLLAQMVSELSALHIFVSGGDLRKGNDQVLPASLGARLSRDQARGGYRVDHVYQADRDYPDSVAPLAKPEVDVREGDVIQTINGVETLSVPDPAVLLRNQAGKQVLLRVRPRGDGETRDVVATPVSPTRLSALRYDDWEIGRRQVVEQQGKGAIGYVHLRAMGPNDMAQWMREFYPVFDRQGLILDVRHNGGGNIDSWVLEKLLRKAWFYWQGRVGRSTWNMQWAFRGHVVVLCDEHTASDGEAFTEGFRRLGLGKVIGTRTWGGEIWLSFNNTLVDNGIASAAETGVYGPEGAWLIEGHGVDPDIVVDNLPHATFDGDDAQLRAALEYLQRQIKEHPVPVPPPPAYPDKSGKPKGQ
jgi:tricorn protease